MPISAAEFSSTTILRYPRSTKGMPVPVLIRALLAACILLPIPRSTADESSASAPLLLKARSRTQTAADSERWHSTTTTLNWNPRETCIIVCDMWDHHWCVPSEQRVGEMAPHMNRVLNAARARGVFIIHCPSDTMEAYADHPARLRAINAAPAETSPPLQKWVRLLPEREGSLPIDDADGGCDCDPPVPSRRVWTRQHPAIEIQAADAITDNDEAFRLMRERGIRNVIVMGVHTNMCVLGRPFSIRQMVLQGQNVVLVRDLTDTMYNPARAPFVSHFSGNDLVTEHIEQYWCPSITSTDLCGEAPFQFRDDKRPHLVVVVSEPEYETEQSLTEFRQELLQRYRVSMVYGDSNDGSVLPGADVITTADLLLLSVRRRTLKPQQLQLFRDFVSAGKPVIGIRTSSHPFHLRNQSPPEGRADWPEFDLQVNGGQYTNHHGNGPITQLEPAAGKEQHPLLKGINLNDLTGQGSLYKVRPLADSTTPVLIGSIPNQESEPVAWINRRADGGHTFYTSLGHRGDFAQPGFRQLLLNACDWLLQQE